jgi:hypothetical protein
MFASRSPTYQLQPGSWPWSHHARRFPIDPTRRQRRWLIRRSWMRPASGR